MDTVIKFRPFKRQPSSGQMFVTTLQETGHRATAANQKAAAPWRC